MFITISTIITDHTFFPFSKARYNFIIISYYNSQRSVVLIKKEVILQTVLYLWWHNASEIISMHLLFCSYRVAFLASHRSDILFSSYTVVEVKIIPVETKRRHVPIFESTCTTGGTYSNLPIYSEGATVVILRLS